jgi:hypothetical protein
VTFKFWEILKNASEVTFIRKNISFLKIVNFVKSSVECKVSLADGTSPPSHKSSIYSISMKNNIYRNNRQKRTDVQTEAES